MQRNYSFTFLYGRLYGRAFATLPSIHNASPPATALLTARGPGAELIIAVLYIAGKDLCVRIGRLPFSPMPEETSWKLLLQLG
jgi:hypothetical protein